MYFYSHTYECACTDVTPVCNSIVGIICGGKTYKSLDAHIYIDTSRKSGMYIVRVIYLFVSVLLYGCIVLTIVLHKACILDRRRYNV